MRIFTTLDRYLTHKLEIRDLDGQVQLVIIRPAKVFKSTVLVQNGAGQEVGRIVQDNIFGKIHFTLDADGQTLGSIDSETGGRGTSASTTAGTEVARITKTFEGIAKAVFTTADYYVVHIHTELPQPLLSLVVAERAVRRHRAQAGFRRSRIAAAGRARGRTTARPATEVASRATSRPQPVVTGVSRRSRSRRR